jgi:hypothetical protein
MVGHNCNLSYSGRRTRIIFQRQKLETLSEKKKPKTENKRTEWIKWVSTKPWVQSLVLPLPLNQSLEKTEGSGRNISALVKHCWVKPTPKLSCFQKYSTSHIATEQLSSSTYLDKAKAILVRPIYAWNQ